MAEFVIKPFEKPSEVRRAFGRNSGLSKWYVPKAIYTQKTRSSKGVGKAGGSQWPTKRLDYEFLNRCKIMVCRVPHPTQFLSKMGVEWQINILPWGRGSYLDIREYRKGQSNPKGLLLHLDVMKAILPEIVQAVRQMELDDQREEFQKADVQVLKA